MDTTPFWLLLLFAAVAWSLWALQRQRRLVRERKEQYQREVLAREMLKKRGTIR